MTSWATDMLEGREGAALRGDHVPAGCAVAAFVLRS